MTVKFGNKHGSAEKCMSCHISFESHKEYLSHYQSDLHRFNLKRKIAGLQPIGKELFDSKLKELKLLEEESMQKKSYFCESCRKLFHSDAQYNAHFNSKKHKHLKLQQQQQHGKKLGMQKLYDKNKKMSGEECLFCELKSPSIDGFSIPDHEYLSDFVGFLNCIRQIIYCEFVCICCEKQFSSPEAIHNHMIDTTHTHMPYESSYLGSISKFYDYTKLEHNFDTVVQTNEYGELILPNSSVMGNRCHRQFYVKNYSHALKGPVFANNSVIHQGVMDNVARAEFTKRSYYRQSEELKIALKQNSLSKLRYRCDCPV